MACIAAAQQIKLGAIEAARKSAAVLAWFGLGLAGGERFLAGRRREILSISPSSTLIMTTFR